MTELYARKIDEVFSQLVMDLPDLAENDRVPAWATMAFMPTAKERNEISLYRLASAEDLHAVAAAVEVKRDQSDLRATHWLVVEVQSLDEIKVDFSSALGDTTNSRVNELHLNAIVPDASIAEAIARVFLSGDAKIVEKKQANAQLELSVRANEFQFCAPDVGSAKAFPYRHIPVWIARGWANASGAPIQEPA